MASDVKITTAIRAGRNTASSGSKWEPLMGYSRAVRSGNFIAVTGTVGVDADGTYSRSLADQTRARSRSSAPRSKRSVERSSR